MRKGVILEVNDRYVTLLTPEGEFLQTHKLKQTYEIGDEIHFFPIQGEKRKHLKFWTGFKGKMMVLVSSIVLVFFTFAPIYENMQVYAYMTIDVNPSIELGLNDHLEVISAEPYNKEGERILSGLGKWKGKDATQVAEQVLDEIEEQGYLKTEDSVLIATVKTDESKNSLDKELNAAITEIKETGEREELEFTVLTGTAEERETAIKEGVTTGVFKEKTQPKPKPGNSQKDTEVPAEIKQPTRDSEIRKATDRTESPKDIQDKKTALVQKNKDSSPAQNNGSQTEKKALKKEEKKAEKIVRKVQKETTKEQGKSQGGGKKAAPTANPKPQVQVEKPVQPKKNNEAGQQQKKTPSAKKPGKSANNNSSRPSVKENKNLNNGKSEKQKPGKVDNKEKKSHPESVPKEHPNEKKQNK